MKTTDQRMLKLRLRRLWEEVLDADLIAVDIEEDEERMDDEHQPIKRLSLVVRYVPA